MKKFFIFLILFIVTFLSFIPKSFAIEDPLSHPNNKIGVHILFTSELQNAAKLINSSGGDWGYVIIPIQSGDKDLPKWQSFMDSCRKLHIIPIIRLATEGDYFNTQVWRKPDYADVLDFANFLSSLDWPTKNRYVVVFNEVNRGDEWGGTPNPTEYANILSYAVSAFKSRSEDFFIISAGMDNAAANTNNAMNEYDFFSQMNQAVPGIFNQIDGMASHSYPNPAFSQPPTVNTRMSISSFSFEKALLDSLSAKSLPVFITETGWSREDLSDNTIASYFTTAFSSVWNNPDIVTVIPFLLQAGSGPFEDFSLLNASGNPTAVYTALQSLSKIKGQPSVNSSVLAAQTELLASLPIKSFSKKMPTIPSPKTTLIAVDFKNIFKWLLQVP